MAELSRWWPSAVLDRAWLIAARRAGAPGGIRFTPRQLYYELCRVLLPLGSISPLQSHVPYTCPVPLSYQHFVELLDQRGTPEGLLTGRLVPATIPSPAADAVDLLDYGIPRLLVCHDPAVAAMLLANDSHLELACPIVSVGDLPLNAGLLRALARAGTPTVMVLHDASPDGIRALTETRSQLGGDATSRRIVSLGIRPRDAARLHLAHQRAQRVRAFGPIRGWTRWEHRWIRAGRVAEVSAVPPARLLAAVHRGIRRSERPRAAATAAGPTRGREVGFLSWPSPARAGS